MGLFDFFEEANEQFKKDVSKAWDELWDNDTSDDIDDCNDGYPILTQNGWFYWAILGIPVIMEYVEPCGIMV